MLDAGHFALDESASDIARLIREFLGRLSHWARNVASGHA